MAEVERMFTQIPGTQEMLTIPGIGVVTLAGFLAKVGDLSGYDHGQKIIRLAGKREKTINYIGRTLYKVRRNRLEKRFFCIVGFFVNFTNLVSTY